MGGSVSTPRGSPKKSSSVCGDGPTKLLLNVTIDNSLGAIQVLMSPEDTVTDLIKAILSIYASEKRRPPLKDTRPDSYDLHYSPFTLQSLKPNDKLKNLGSRNFFLCSRSPTI
ncbi:hypothetical protein PIB30_057668 [Stylosanthes scabra]|uniref:DUF7054 domain-containing protein n=1 Tax=Stylosanthes scabra TaxID=79078 RepID=A0ABU6RK54_9FABA|nr:hypothetical protein [Stylosanthes scabra]